MGMSIFKVLQKSESFVFISVELPNIDKVAEQFVDYFFSESNVFAYFKSLESSCIFAPTKANYAYLYNALSKFYDADRGSEELPRLDKVGKIGEYFLSILLLDYYNFDCIYPKLLTITSNNMSVFGIDTLFYSSKLNLMMFGEAKFTDSLIEGISQLERSLDEYESKLRSEFLFMSTNLPEATSNQRIKDIFEKGNCAISMEDFLKDAGFSAIGIPLFVCHGEEMDETIILEELKTIKIPKKILGFDVVPICISLPVNNKNSFIQNFIKNIKERANYYAKLRE